MTTPELPIDALQSRPARRLVPLIALILVALLGPSSALAAQQRLSTHQ